MVKMRSKYSKYLIFITCLAVVVALQGFFVAQAATQIIVSDTTVAGVTESSATITWTTDLPGNSEIRFAQDLLSLYLADWQTKQAFAADLVNHQVTLTGLDNNTYYIFEVRSTDQSGSEPVSDGGHFTTGANGLGDLTVSNIAVSGITETAATVRWTSSAAGDSQIRFATSEAGLVTADWEFAQFYQPGLLDHSTTLTNLEPQTTYYFEVRTTNLSVGDSISGTGSFTTAASQLADLLPVSITYPDTTKLYGGNMIVFSSGVKNQGQKNADGFNVKWFVDGVQKDYGAHSGVTAGATNTTGNSKYNWVATPGTHTIRFEVDSDSYINESNEGNNAATLQVTIKNYGDPFTWQNYTWKPIYVVYGNDSANGYGQWYADGQYLHQDQVSALHYRIVATSMTSLSNYEVKMVFRLRTGKQIALCGRMDDNGNGYCFVSEWGNSNTMLAYIGNNEQNPAHIKQGTTFSVQPNTDYVMKLRFEGSKIMGKIYPFNGAEPEAWAAVIEDGRFTIGKIGFFTYGSQPTIKSVDVTSVTVQETNQNENQQDSPDVSTTPESDQTTETQTSSNTSSTGTVGSASGEEAALLARIVRLEYRLSELERQVVEAEKRLATIIDQALTSRLRGQILLQVEENGEAWYVDPITDKKFYLKDGESAYKALNAFGLGVSNVDLNKIPIGVEDRADLADSDDDGLDDKLEEAIGTNPTKTDTDGDGFSDGEEVRQGHNPLGGGSVIASQTLVNQLRGRILLQVEKNGEAWYLNPADGKRYYMKDGQLAYQIMRFLSLGITNNDLRKIDVGSLE